MYAQHFGFSRPLFSDGLAQDDGVFRTQALEQLVRDLTVALTRKDSVVVISGMSGTGKSTIATDALKSIHTRLAFCCVSHTPLTPHELLEQLLTDFGFEPYKRSRVERLQLWRQFLSEMAATETRVCLLIENADALSAEVLLGLNSLTAADAALSPGANIVLTTTQAPERILTSEAMLAFNQRVRLRRRIDALSESETRDYLAFKCQEAGADPDAVFGDGVASRLYELSAGVFRVIENLLESALISAAAAGDASVTAGRLTDTAEQQFGITRLLPEQVDDLLVESASHDGTKSVPRFDEIPTLTEFVGMLNEDEPIELVTDERAPPRQLLASRQH
ncbi:MAG TPA: AAA family ATPase [Gammaproteobacteria bacterium]|nr:AAA family ATPase [Gammaproteobacteria bacterium]